MNIFERINEVRKKIDYIRKEKVVQNYKAVTHDQVTAILRPYLIDFGIVIIPSLKSSVTVDTGERTSKGTPILRVEAEYIIEFVNMTDPSDRFSSAVSAHANDTGDKAPGKALSYAKKAVVLKVFEIETGEDEESRYQTNDAEMLSEKQFAEFKSKIEATLTKENAKLEWHKAVKACEAVKDLSSANMLKQIMLDHANFIDQSNKEAAK